MLRTAHPDAFRVIHENFSDPGFFAMHFAEANPCLLYTSDAADERSSVDLGGRRIIKKKKKITIRHREQCPTK